ncbi:uncharacterized protein K452DRAFT_216623, partial [Aplosporella prunicola CBS 121167]
MGAGQSSANDSGASQESQAAKKTSYYELLGIERTATEDEIKKAYRRKALELHPDRNFGREEWATALFAEIQSAHQVLSDPQERAWYDSHESAILSGADPSDVHYEHNLKVTTADDITRMMRKFNARVDYSDSPSGFFGFLRETFDTLAREEEAAASWEGYDPVDYPNFGHKDDSYEDVVRTFYAVWGGFSTKKTFSWKDNYRLSDAPDRRTRRWMEKENQRLRDEGIREFNVAVSTLVAFVRKRDPRWLPNTQSEAERQKALRDMAAAQAARQRAANEALMQEEVPEWTRTRDPEELEEEDEEEIEEEHYECVACNKTFKSERQWEAHEKSKKHQKAVYALQKKMRKENKNLNLDDEIPSSGIETPENEAEEFDLMEDAGPTADDVAEEIEHVNLSDDDAASIEEATARKPAPDPEEEASNASTDSDSDYAPRSKVQSRFAAARPLSPEQTPAAETPEAEEEEAASPVPNAPKLGKAAQKRAKRAAAAAAAEQAPQQFACAVCKAAFPSKTKMFEHVREEGHAAPPSVAGKAGGG